MSTIMRLWDAILDPSDAGSLIILRDGEKVLTAEVTYENFSDGPAHVDHTPGVHDEMLARILSTKSADLVMLTQRDGTHSLRGYRASYGTLNATTGEVTARVYDEVRPDNAPASADVNVADFAPSVTLQSWTPANSKVLNALTPAGGNLPQHAHLYVQYAPGQFGRAHGQVRSTSMGVLSDDPDIGALLDEFVGAGSWLQVVILTPRGDIGESMYVERRVWSVESPGALAGDHGDGIDISALVAEANDDLMTVSVPVPTHAVTIS